MYKCEKCDHEVELRLTAAGERKPRSAPIRIQPANNNATPTAKTRALSEMTSLPVCVKLSYNGFWVTSSHDKHVSVNDETCDRNSVMLDTNCLLYVYKLALRHYLLSKRIITPYDIDAQNLVPHVVVRKSRGDTQSKYNTVNGESFIIDESMLSVKNDFLLIELDEKRDLHMTLIYSKKIKSKCDLKEALKTVIGNLNEYPESIALYSNLDYFGEAEADYWYNTPDSYPLDICRPLNYQPYAAVKTIPQNITSAGSIL